MTHGLLSMCRSDAARSCTTAYMRSFLRYLQWASFNPRELSQFVPRTPGWRQSQSVFSVALPQKESGREVGPVGDAALKMDWTKPLTTPNTMGICSSVPRA